MELPADHEAEQIVLGAMLLQPAVIDEITLILEPIDFNDPRHAVLYRHVRDQHESGRPIDPKLLIDRLQADVSHQPNCWEYFGGATALGRLMHSPVSPDNGMFHARRVRECALRRELLSAGAAIVDESRASDTVAAQALENAQGRIWDIAERSVASEPIDAGDLMRNVLAELEQRIDGQHGTGVKTGLHELDDLLGGMRPGQLLILAARPSMGKSALALNIAENAAFDGVTTLFVSLEMGAIELADRLLSGVAKVDAYRMRSGVISADERHRLVDAAGAIANLPLFVIDDAGLSARQIAAHARRIRRKGSLGLIVVDYMQLVEPESGRVSREQQVAAISRALKALAKQLDVPVLVLAQLNRKVEEGNNQPRLSHLRESGSIEQDADVVMFVHREEYYKPDDDTLRGIADIIVAKQRNGQTGTAEVIWRRQFTRFENRAPSRFEDEAAVIAFNDSTQQGELEF